MTKNIEYTGFEVGPIRPPSEAESLLIRVTRNCPWNKCRFCGLYKGKSFSVRPKEHVIKDIDLVKECVDTINDYKESMTDDRDRKMSEFTDKLGESGMWAYQSALMWMRSGMKSVFIQDANSMVIKADDMVEILNYLRAVFPDIERITTYARSHTIARMNEDDLKRIAEAGLNRIHIGMESGCDKVLELVEKGVVKEQHVTAGQKVMRSGIELSEYYMPGLGGLEYLEENAIESADALNQINPDFIRIRTLAVPEKTLLHEDYENGVFKRTTDVDMVRELLIFIRNLEGITSTVKSDHILNLVTEVEGKLPEDKEKMVEALEKFLSFSKEDQMIYRIGRRMGIMNRLFHVENESKRKRIMEVIEKNNINLGNIDAVTDSLIKRFI
ncbi:Radical SAM superfamily protein [Dethiosulfatibacter aminovorans DSM 17477]|uniref:Radical SAM superfamily protein n=1 Tax=Dethiosulfatibacter aminovorans DSM 17477 TaxID=1121476 RepID=A0A1M6KTU9_9FIRM|nr:radical SAM protein [Dethiosulfatibacter aminovorans]SHJ62397.1 Radical SAM superfamily protein [Dethiosulfatibacter aminovorans DSM 17477]